MMGTINAENDFADALHDLHDRVDSVLFDVQPWQQWTEFGACFYAMRINAFLLLGCSTVTLGELLPGAKMTAKTSRVSVNLVPSRVVKTADQYGSSIGPEICLDEYERIDWTSGGRIVLSEDNEAGVDIFFTLKETKTNNLTVFVDRRKRHNGPFKFRHAKKHFKQMDVLPQFLEGSGVRLVRGVMNCASSSNLGMYEMDHDCFLLPREKNETFHGTLAYHPACSPVVDINSASLTALRSVLKGSKEAVDEAIEVILRKRNKPSRGFSNFEAFDVQVLKKLKVGIEENAWIAP
ncbi:hypothetical protein P3T76_007743 [Phytophthora citrophthora]|uniref:Uncharacterized protein n=1 Tax=Phytophthora citrophthora TaxID=4793 RepID=A0AAD9GM90_9STRA|nr:hypothetical protein P3T76_007743 [Phytophthora citrophthora]